MASTNRLTRSSCFGGPATTGATGAAAARSAGPASAAAQLSPAQFVAVAFSERAMAAYRLTFGASFLAAVVATVIYIRGGIGLGARRRVVSHPQLRGGEAQIARQTRKRRIERGIADARLMAQSVAEQLIGLADELHIGVLDAVVHHFHEVPRAVRADVGAARRAVHLGRDRGQDRLDRGVRVARAARHDAGTEPRAFLAARYADAANALAFNDNSWRTGTGSGTGFEQGSPVGVWLMNESAGSTEATDASGSGHTATGMSRCSGQIQPVCSRNAMAGQFRKRSPQHHLIE